MGVLNFAVGEMGLMAVGIEVGDRKLHKLQDDVFDASPGLELAFDITPAFPLATTHEIQQLYIVLKAPV